VGEDLVLGEETKLLRVSGDVTVSMDGDPQEMVVTSVEALPGDPMRARWDRRADRALTGAELASQLRGSDPWGIVDMWAKTQEQQTSLIREAFVKLQGPAFPDPFANLQLDPFTKVQEQQASSILEAFDKLQPPLPASAYAMFGPGSIVAKVQQQQAALISDAFGKLRAQLPASAYELAGLGSTVAKLREQQGSPLSEAIETLFGNGFQSGSDTGQQLPAEENSGSRDPGSEAVE
jgi:hypothetical protein